MRMNELVNTRFCSTLAKPSQEVTNEEMKNAYEHFVEKVKAVSNFEDNITVMRTLSITRIELVFLLKQNQCEQGKKCA